MEKILIVEDDITLRGEMIHFLRNNGYEAEALCSFLNPVKDILDVKADLILLDIGIPGISGTYVCRSIRDASRVPIIMVTSSSSEIDEMLSLTYGADDYITKPFNPQILLLRMERVLSRFSKTEPPVLTYKEIRLNLSRCIIERGEKEIDLSKNEMKILAFLLRNKGRIVTREEIMDDLWGNQEFIDDNTLTVNITRIRKKLGELGYENVIETKRGQGYLIV